jgi:hypothetical protein
MTYLALFRQLHRSSSSVALCVEMMRERRSKDKAAIVEALSAISEAIRRNRRGHAMSAARTLLLLAGPGQQNGLRAVLLMGNLT